MRKTIYTVGTAIALVVSVAHPVQATPIDCAILLCMAGGFPASAECLTAKAEVIRRVTPWPVEPPLQIWRCPMGGGLPSSVGRADVDISGPEFDFARSIEVWHIEIYQHTKRGSRDRCRENFRIYQGTYGSQGEFSWAPAQADQVPEWMNLNRQCGGGSFYRGIGFSFEDFEGQLDYEVINY